MLNTKARCKFKRRKGCFSLHKQAILLDSLQIALSARVYSIHVDKDQIIRGTVYHKGKRYRVQRTLGHSAWITVTEAAREQAIKEYLALQKAA